MKLSVGDRKDKLKFLVDFSMKGIEINFQTAFEILSFFYSIGTSTKFDVWIGG